MLRFSVQGLPIATMPAQSRTGVIGNQGRRRQGLGALLRPQGPAAPMAPGAAIGAADQETSQRAMAVIDVPLCGNYHRESRGEEKPGGGGGAAPGSRDASPLVGPRRPCRMAARDHETRWAREGRNSASTRTAKQQAIRRRPRPGDAKR